MKSSNNYKIYWSPKFAKEFKNIFSYINLEFRPSHTSNNLQNKIINLIYSLNFSPERFPKIANFKYKNRNIRKIVYKNYIIIYEVQNSTR